MVLKGFGWGGVTAAKTEESGLTVQVMGAGRVFPASQE